MKCHSCLKRLEPDWKFCPECGVEAIIDETQRLKSPGVNFLPKAFTENTYRFASALAEDPTFYSSFVRYILTTREDVMQTGRFRAELEQETRDYAKLHKANFEHLLWCALSLATDKYFEEKGKAYDWNAADEEDVRSNWYKLIAKVFLSQTNENGQQQDVYKPWQEKFIALHKLEAGPMKTCQLCTSKCFYQYDVQTLTDDQNTIQDFEFNVNSKMAPASESAAIFTNLLAYRTIGIGNVDLAYCFSVHLLNSLELKALDAKKFSMNAQVVLAQKIRSRLEEQAKKAVDDLNEVDPEALSMRQQVFEVIVRQAMAGSPWRDICAGPMQVQRITVEEVEAEIKRRSKNR